MRRIALFGGLAVLALVLLAAGAWWLRTRTLDMPLSARLDDTLDLKFPYIPRADPAPSAPPEQRSDAPSVKVEPPPGPLPRPAQTEPQMPSAPRDSAEAPAAPAVPLRADQAITERKAAAEEKSAAEFSAADRAAAEKAAAEKAAAEKAAAERPAAEKAAAEKAAAEKAAAERAAAEKAAAEILRRDRLSEEMASLHRSPPTNPFNSLVASRPDAGIGEQRRMAERKQVLDNLPKGKIVLDAPSSMKVGENRGVHANVGINVPADALRRYVRTGDQAAESVLSVSSEMAATLTGSAFKITATTPERQGVAEGRPTVWSWDIEARDAGEQELEATLYVLLPGGDDRALQRIDSFTHKIGVTVKEQTWGDWLKARKEEIDAVKTIVVTLAGAASAVFGWLGWSYARRRRNENRGATT